MKHPIKIKIDKSTAGRIFVDTCTIFGTLFITVIGIIILIMIAKVS